MAAAGPTLASFDVQPWWLIVLKAEAVLVFLLLGTVIAIWAERRLIGRMQNRPGPNRAGPFDLLQPIADALKLAFKEDIAPMREQAALLDGSGAIGHAGSNQLRDRPVRPGGLDGSEFHWFGSGLHYPSWYCPSFAV